MGDLKNYNIPHIPKVLPQVYDDALSYYEVMGNLVNKINEMIDYVNDIQDTFLSQANAYTDTKFANIETEFANYKREVNSLIENLDDKYADFVKIVNARMAIADAHIAEISARVDSAVAESAEYTNQAIANNNEYIISETTKALDTVTVINYFTGTRITIQAMFDYLANFHLNNAISYTQLANREKTYNELIAYNMTYTDLALNGGTIIQ